LKYLAHIAAISDLETICVLGVILLAEKVPGVKKDFVNSTKILKFVMAVLNRKIHRSGLMTKQYNQQNI